MTESSTPRAEARTVRLKDRRRVLAIGVAALGALAVAIAVAVVMTFTAAPSVAIPAVAAPSGAIPASLPAYAPLDAAAIASLPEARYDGVIPGLIPVSSKDVGSTFRTAQLNGYAPLFGAGAKNAVARLNPIDFTGAASAIAVARTTGDWALILTPARAQQPSATSGHAAAQTAAWIPTSYLTNVQPAAARITVDTTALTMTITQTGVATQTFPIAAGKDSTPTPTGVTGYLQARYVDASQGTGTTQIQLTSLHSVVEDDPAGGSSGGLIAIHYFPASTGKISHGCIRVEQAAVTAVNKLPIGTPITTR